MDTIDVLIIAAKVLVAFGFLLTTVMLTIWAERRVVARMQQRIGPNRVGPFGILQTLADGIKLFFKEDIAPAMVDRPVYFIAPLASFVPALVSFAVVPFGNAFTIGDRRIEMQVADLGIGMLFFLAMGSLMVYGIVLAGWSSGSAYPLLGAVRSSAQMVSYELAMGLSLVAVVIAAGSLSTREIVEAQAGTYFGVLPHWFVFSQLPAFVIFLIAGFAETNRAPFDLPEAETELVAGYHTEYSGIKFAMFFLAEYVHVITISAIVVTLFLGGWRGPSPAFARPLFSVVWFLVKLVAMITLFIWARATIPRVRYDRLMTFGWKVMLPASVVWVMVTATLVVLEPRVERSSLVAAIGIAFGLLTLWFLARTTAARAPEIRAALSRKETPRGAA